MRAAIAVKEKQKTLKQNQKQTKIAHIFKNVQPNFSYAQAINSPPQQLSQQYLMRQPLNIHSSYNTQNNPGTYPINTGAPIPQNSNISNNDLPTLIINYNHQLKETINNESHQLGLAIKKNTKLICSNTKKIELLFNHLNLKYEL